MRSAESEGRLRPSRLRGGPLRAFSFADFRLLWVSSLAFMISFAMASTARGWLILELTDSAFMVTAVQAVSWLPMMVVPPFGGLIADRLNKKSILIVSDAANLVILLALAILLFADVITVWQVFLLAVLNGVVFSLAMPTRTSSVPEVVEQTGVGNGVALFTAIFSLSQLLGPTLAGYIMDLTPDQLGWPFLVGSVLLVPAIFLLSKTRFQGSPGARPVSPTSSVLSGLGEGLTHIRSSRLLLGLVLLGLTVALFGMPYYTLLPVIARDILEVGPDGLGLLGAAGGVGAIAGAGIIAAFSNSRWLRALMLGGGVSTGILLIFFGISTIFPASLVISLGLGLLLQLFYTGAFTMVQVASPAAIRGRVFGMFMLAMGVSPLGMLLLGVEAEVFSPTIALVITGAALAILLVVVAAAVPEIRRLGLVPSGETSASPSGL